MTESTEPVRVVIADDDPAVVAALVSAFGRRDDILVVGTASDGTEALRIISKTRPDVALLDVGMPNVDGIDVALVVSQDYPPVRTLIHSGLLSEAYLKEVMAAKASGYISKGVSSDQVASAILAVNAGLMMFNDDPAGIVRRSVFRAADVNASEIDEVLIRKVERLTRRKRELVKALVQEGSYRQIAQSMGLSANTVKVYATRLFDEFDCSSRPELVSLLIEGGYLQYLKDKGQ